MKTGFGGHTKKDLHTFFERRLKSQIQTHFDSQAHWPRNENKGVETSAPKLCVILSGFSNILPTFSTNQNFWGLARSSSTILECWCAASSNETSNYDV